MHLGESIAAAAAMRRILIDSARAKSSLKRGGERQPEILNDEQARVAPLADEILDVNDALIELEAEDPEHGRKAMDLCKSLAKPET